jgi:hypothetical protein
MARGYLAGRLIVRLHGDAVEKVREDIPHQRFHRQKKRARAFGIDTIDTTLADAGTHSIRRLFRGGATRDPLYGYYVVRFDPNRSALRVRQALAGEKHVAHAQPDFVRQLLDLGHGQVVSNLDVRTAIDWPEGAAMDASLARPLIAVIDTGIQLNPPHPYLAANTVGLHDVVDLEGEQPPDGFFWATQDADGEDDEPTDEVGHGTHVAGIAAGQPVGGFSGIAPNARILAIRALAKTIRGADNSVSAFATSSNVAAAVRLATQQGAAVINMSFGFNRQSGIENNALDFARESGAILVAAIGNDGAEGRDLYPARHPGVIAVGASAADGSRWPGSQTGSHLFIMAPGEDVMSTDLGGTFQTRSGTSIACAIVAGVAALMKSVKPKMTPDQAAATLKQTASSGDNRDDETGWGLVNATRAVDAARQ